MMNADRWHQVSEIYHAARARTESERATFLAEVCRGDEELRREVESLLAQPVDTDAFLAGSVIAVAADRVYEASPTTMSRVRFADYQLEERIGAGGMGEVYRARDTKLHREVAIKILPRAFTADPDRVARFDREARLVASLNHPNVGAIYTVVQEAADDGLAVRGLVLELVEGETLAERLDRGPMPAGPTVAIARQLVDALDAAHEKGIVHRDLKPANIKITPEGTVKVLDFGLAKAAAGDEARADVVQSLRDGVILGTAAYMSPEQARGRPVDKRADIWAFGCVVYEMLTGRAAFARKTITDTLAAVVEHEPDWEMLPAAAPPGVIRLLRRSLEKDPKLRLRDIGDARIDLDDARGGSTARPPAVTTPVGRAWLAASAAAVLFLVMLAVVAWNIMSTPSGGPGLGVLRAVRLTNTSAQEFGPAISPDGKWVAYYSNARGLTDVWVRFLDSGATTNLTASLNLELPARVGIGGLAISPDGTSIVFGVRSDPSQPIFDTWVMPAPVGGAPRKFLEGLQGVQWSPDGKQLACIRPGSSRGDALILADRDGGNQREIIAPQGGRHIHWPVWSPDGLYVYFIYSLYTWHDEPSEIYRIAVTGGAPERVVSSVRRAIYPVPLANGDLVYAGNHESVDLGLWWLPYGHRSPRLLTPAVGEYSEMRVSVDGRHLVSTLTDRRQSLVYIPVSGGVPHRRSITDGDTDDVEPSFDVRGDRIVFSSSRAGNRNLWIARPDGGDARPLTSGSAFDERPVFSPDGRQIAFVSDRSGQRGIWIISAEGGAARLLTAAVALDTLTWSRDGRRVVYAVPGGDLPYLVSVSVIDGTTESILTPGPGVAPAWSPTADVIAYLEPATLPAQDPSLTPAATLWLAFVDTQGKRLYPNLPKQSFSNGFVAWAPDGRRLAAVWNPANGVSSIWVVEPDGPEPLKKLGDLPLTVRPRGITWTGDGSGVIIAQQESVSDIVLFELSNRDR